MTAFSYYCLDGLGMLALANSPPRLRRCALLAYFHFGVWRDGPTKRSRLFAKIARREEMISCSEDMTLQHDWVFFHIWIRILGGIYLVRGSVAIVSAGGVSAGHHFISSCHGVVL